MQRVIREARRKETAVTREAGKALTEQNWETGRRKGQEASKRRGREAGPHSKCVKPTLGLSHADCRAQDFKILLQQSAHAGY